MMGGVRLVKEVVEGVGWQRHPVAPLGNYAKSRPRRRRLVKKPRSGFIRGGATEVMRVET